MKNWLISLGVNCAALWVAILVVPGFGLVPGRFGNQFTSLLVLGLIFGLVNSLIKPIAQFFSFPFLVVTLGLFAFVVNAGMLQLVEWISGKVGLAFIAGDFFWTTLAAAVVISFVSTALNLVLPDGK